MSGARAAVELSGGPLPILDAPPLPSPDSEATFLLGGARLRATVTPRGVEIVAGDCALTLHGPFHDTPAAAVRRSATGVERTLANGIVERAFVAAPLPLLVLEWESAQNAELGLRFEWRGARGDAPVLTHAPDHSVHATLEDARAILFLIDPPHRWEACESEGIAACSATLSLRAGERVRAGYVAARAGELERLPAAIDVDSQVRARSAAARRRDAELLRASGATAHWSSVRAGVHALDVLRFGASGEPRPPRASVHDAGIGDAWLGLAALVAGDFDAARDAVAASVRSTADADAEHRAAHLLLAAEYFAWTADAAWLRGALPQLRDHVEALQRRASRGCRVATGAARGDAARRSGERRRLRARPRSAGVRAARRAAGRRARPAATGAAAGARKPRRGREPARR